MKKIIDEAFYTNMQNILQSDRINSLENIVEISKSKLKENLNERQRKHLLRIEDAKGLIAEECGYASFVAGFKLGVKIGYEVNKD